MSKRGVAYSALFGLGAWICLAVICALSMTAYANIITVTNTQDSGPGSLRQALADANDGDTIDFDPSINGQTITLTSAELAINTSVMISGPGAQFLTISISGIQLTRIFHVMPGQSVTIDGLKIGETLPGDCTGGILNDHATLTVSNCIVDQNCAGQNGGGIDNDAGGGTATLTVVNSTVSFNRLVPYGQGGGIRNNNGSLMVISSDITGNTATSKGEPDGSIGGGIYSAGGTLEITNSTISGNHVNIGGGGFYGSGTITNSVITGNTATPFKASAGMGGGVWTQGVLTLSGCTVSNNIAEAGGGGILNFGTLTVTSCTINDNMAQGKHTLSPQGGGIDNYSDSASLEISNSTITNNVAGGGGGGIYNRNGNSTITCSTLSGNNGVNGGAIHNGATLEIKNNVLNVGDFGPNIFNDGGTITSDGYNLSSDDGGGYLIGPGDQINTNPLLGPLQDNGGPTFTHQLLTGSPAIDTGDPNFTPPPDYDQRGPGFDRVVDGRIDIGSFEAQAASSSTPTPTASPPACSIFENFDQVTPPALPPAWTAINLIDPDGILWQTSNSGNPTPPAESPPNAGWINDPDTISDKYLYSPSESIEPLSSADLHFSNNYALQDGFDGGVLEISVDAGPFQDILAAGGSFSRGGYNGSINTCCGNPLAGRQAWTGNSGGFIDTDVDLTGFGGHTIALRWRMGSDSSISGQGWRIDTVQMICERPTPTATATLTPTATVSPTPTASPTPSEPPMTPSPTPSATFTPTSTPTTTPPPTPIPRVTPTPRLRPTPAPRP